MSVIESFMYARKSVGQRTVPCGTPDKTLREDERNHQLPHAVIN